VNGIRGSECNFEVRVTEKVCEIFLLEDYGMWSHPCFLCSVVYVRRTWWFCFWSISVWSFV